jgi:hypothetical protein
MWGGGHKNAPMKLKYSNIALIVVVHRDIVFVSNAVLGHRIT